MELRLNRIKRLEPPTLVQTVVRDPIGGCAGNVVDHGQHFKTCKI